MTPVFARPNSLSSFFLSEAFLAALAMRALNESFSFTRLDCHSASRADAICFIVRPVLTDSSSRFFEIGFTPPAVFIKSHWFFPSWGRMRMSAHSPLAFSPCKIIWNLPLRTASTGSPAGVSSYVPQSQTMTVPPPYCPSGMMPSKSAYSIGWSSTSTARCFSACAHGRPFGTAHDFRTPSISNRKS